MREGCSDEVKREPCAEASGKNSTHACASASMNICVCKGRGEGQGVSGWAALFVLPFARMCGVFAGGRGGARRVGLAHPACKRIYTY